jgi:hypothetical protein
MPSRARDKTRQGQLASTIPSLAGLVVLAGSMNPIPSRTRPLNSPAPMVLSLKTWKSRSLPGLPRTEILFTNAPFSLLREISLFAASLSANLRSARIIRKARAQTDLRSRTGNRAAFLSYGPCLVPACPDGAAARRPCTANCLGWVNGRAADKKPRPRGVTAGASREELGDFTTKKIQSHVSDLTLSQNIGASHGAWASRPHLTQKGRAGRPRSGGHSTALFLSRALWRNAPTTW